MAVAVVEIISRVYPRSRGAAGSAGLRTSPMGGLSPLARGSPDSIRRRTTGWGSIPARAGQPIGQQTKKKCMRVYPRSRGAAPYPHPHFPYVPGLSPLARGSQQLLGALAGLEGSIPARAGQPTARAPCRIGRGVYPRSRGAAWHWPIGSKPFRGLSPLARGSPALPSPAALAPGSIPARAGQPPSSRPWSLRCGVYPRSRGAAGHGGNVFLGRLGLSPLARGSPAHSTSRRHTLGSIPARAGQPRPAPARCRA